MNSRSFTAANEPVVNWILLRHAPVSPSASATGIGADVEVVTVQPLINKLAAMQPRRTVNFFMLLEEANVEPRNKRRWCRMLVSRPARKSCEESRLLSSRTTSAPTRKTFIVQQSERVADLA